ncbi:hypothetical protein [Curtobacterium sp. VKM Ac-2922]|uniref:hypothetical protein n=1 Tax=Curtobacterium sp. VKM Ac-2922 TaxID=2929475 RepID=UPI001FB35632|nr:hypothetical protein [Curtobacterium sp. VKM Ac-2922]MCJ1715784.1 hypothetical protein [Curtobacterium sp. VKM Ac-2922]
MNTDLPAPTWTWRASILLELRALGWMLGATLPVATTVCMLVAATVPAVLPEGWESTGFRDVGYGLVVLTMMEVYGAIPTVVGAVVALPFTMLLGLLMRPVRRPGLHVLATCLLAGTLAAVPLALGPFAWVLFTPVSLAAGAAGALARHGALRRAARTVRATSDWEWPAP